MLKKAFCKKSMVLVLVLVMLGSVLTGCGLGGGDKGDNTNWPEDTITLVSAYGAGGVVDTVLRGMVPYLSDILGVPVIVEIKEGAAGKIGDKYVYDAKPDGYTFLSSNFDDLVMGQQIENAKYDAEKFTYIHNLVVSPWVLVVPSGSPYKTLDDFLAASEENTFKLANIGAGGSSHLQAILLEKYGDLDVTHVPFSGGGPAIAAIMGGHVDCGIVGLTPVMASVREGKSRILAVMAPQRFDCIPDIPAITENLEDIPANPFLIGLAAPPDLPEEIAIKMGEAVAEVLSDDSFLAWAEKANILIDPLEADEFRDQVLAQQEIVIEYKDLLQNN